MDGQTLGLSSNTNGESAAVERQDREYFVVGQGIFCLVLDDTGLGAGINFISAFVLVPLKRSGKDLGDVHTVCGFVGKRLNSFPI